MNAKPGANGLASVILEIQPDSVYREVALNTITAERDGSTTDGLYFFAMR